MIHLLGHTAPIRSTRLGRAFVWALILGVIALFSLMPFGQPVVASPLRAAAFPAPATQVQVRAELAPDGGHMVCAQQSGGGTSYGMADGSHHVFGNRNQAGGDLLGLPSFEHKLFAGLRACASLRPASARHVALAAQRRLHLRARAMADAGADHVFLSRFDSATNLVGAIDAALCGAMKDFNSAQVAKYGPLESRKEVLP